MKAGECQKADIIGTDRQYMNNCVNYSSAPFQFGMQNDTRCYEDLNSSLCVATKPQQNYLKKYRLINMFHMNPNVSDSLTFTAIWLSADKASALSNREPVCGYPVYVYWG